jgi:adenine-specific DNA-methyltransferase
MDLSKSLGQYFTKSKLLKDKVVGFIQNNPEIILEPSVGRGDLVIATRRKFSNVNFDLYEIDDTIKPLPTLSKNKINYTDFLNVSITKTYTTIIGNPPYVRVKSSLNLYLQFIEKCYKLLDHLGELIFIVPSDFGRGTGSKKVVDEMLKVGYFTDIYYPNSEKLFKGASVDVMIFRYILGKSNPLEKDYKVPTNFTLRRNNKLVKDYFDVYVGIVSGRDAIYKNKLGTNKVLVKENTRHTFIIPKTFPTGDEEVDDYLLKNKETLLGRKIRKFNEDNWFEWGALRNYKRIQKLLGQECLYISTLTRNERVCFKGEVEFFSGNLLILVPKIETVLNLNELCEYFNSKEFREEHTYSGRFKMGQSGLAGINLPHTL